MKISRSKQVKAIGYIRVAAPVQKEEELSIQMQKQQILEIAKCLNVEIVEWFIQEGREPVTFRNSTLNQAIEYCEESPAIKYLLVASIARLSLFLEHCIYWQTAFERVGVIIETPEDMELESPTHKGNIFPDPIESTTQAVSQLDN